MSLTCNVMSFDLNRPTQIRSNGYTILTYVPPVPRDIIFAKYYHERVRYGNTKQKA